MSKVVGTQTRNPFALRTQKSLDDENFHYLPVQKDTKNFTSNLPMYLDAESPTRPGEPMYQIVADGSKSMEERAMAGAPDNVLLRCSKADENAILQSVHSETVERSSKKLKTVLKDREGREYESDELVQGGILTA